MQPAATTSQPTPTELPPELLEFYASLIASDDHSANNPTAVAFRRHPDELTEWAIKHLVNRDDVWVSYLPIAKRENSNSITSPPVDSRGAVKLGSEVIRAHFTGYREADVIALHAVSQDDTCKWIGWDIDNHNSDAADTNLKALMLLVARLSGLGFHPLVNESDGKGGYHVRVLFRVPVSSLVAYHFVRDLVADFQQRNFRPPEVCPYHHTTTVVPYGYALRLLGRHHTEPFWPRILDTASKVWLEGEPSVQYVLGLTGDDAGLIPAAFYKLPAPQPKIPAPTGKPHSPVFAAPSYSDNRCQLCIDYVEKLDASVQGNRGSDKLYRVACECIRFGLDDDDAQAVFKTYNIRAKPPWSVREWQHKLSDAKRNVLPRQRGDRLLDFKHRNTTFLNVSTKGLSAYLREKIDKHKVADAAAMARLHRTSDRNRVLSG